MEFVHLLYQKILSNQVLLSLLSGFLGALIGGFATFKSVDKTHKNNIEEEKQKIRNSERAVVLSIVEEVKVLKEIYETKLENCFAKLEDADSYLDEYYIATQDFFTIYTNNADKIGIISDDKLRNTIVKTYIYMKKFVEDFGILKSLQDDLSHKLAVYDELVSKSQELKNDYLLIKENICEIIDKANNLYGDGNERI